MEASGVSVDLGLLGMFLVVLRHASGTSGFLYHNVGLDLVLKYAGGGMVVLKLFFDVPVINSVSLWLPFGVLWYSWHASEGFLCFRGVLGPCSKSKLYSISLGFVFNLELSKNGNEHESRSFPLLRVYPVAFS